MVIGDEYLDNLLKYAIKLAFLNQLYREELLSKSEYDKILNDLKLKHQINLMEINNILDKKKKP